MDDIDLSRAVATEFAALADLLRSATEAQWDTASLCEDWRVREVVAHMTMAARYSEPEFMAELGRCDFDFGRLSNKIASQDAELPTAELVADLGSEVMRNWTPPGGGWHGALSHVVIHGLDVTVPLGVPRRSPDGTVRVILEDLTEGGEAHSVRRRCRAAQPAGHRHRLVVRIGPAAAQGSEDLVLVLSGRSGRVAGWEDRMRHR